MQPPPAAHLVVEPFYPENGKNWLDYVGGDPYAEPLGRDDLPCTYTYVDNGIDNPRYHACAHGGELKRVVTEFPDCATLESAGPYSVDDALGVFDWKCRDQDNHAVFVTKGLLPSRGLSDLIDFPTLSFKPNRLLLTRGGVELAASTPAAWWANDIVEAPTNTTALTRLDQSGTLYVIRGNARTDGYHITVPRVGLIVAPTFVLGYSGSGNLNCDAAGTLVGAPVFNCFVASAGQPFLWFEGQFLGEGTPSWATDALTLVQTRFTVVRNASVRHGKTASLWLNASTNNLLVNVEVSSSAAADFNGCGLGLNDSDGNELNGLRVHNNSGDGVRLANADWNAFSGLSAWQNGTDALPGANVYLATSNHNRLEEVSVAAAATEGISIRQGSSANVVANVRTASNGAEGVWLYDPDTADNIVTQVTCTANALGCVLVGNGAHGTTVSHVTAANGGSSSQSPTSGVGVSLQQQSSAPTNNTFNQIAVVHGAGPCVIVEGDKTLISQLAATGCETGVDLRSGDATFVGNLLLGDDTNDCVLSGAGTGLTAACANTNTSAATYTHETDMTGAFVGKTADPVHPGAPGGVQLYENITEWTSFANTFRGWGAAGDVFPSIANQAPCVAGVACQIWDWRLKPGDLTPLRNVSGNGVSANDPFVADQPCPGAVNGNVVLTDRQSSPQTFLVNAVEVLDDFVGDDDGLCESRERCIYSPNFGAYQGEGNFWDSGRCQFVNGTATPSVVDVLMHAYPVNGAP